MEDRIGPVRGILYPLRFPPRQRGVELAVVEPGEIGFGGIGVNGECVDQLITEKGALSQAPAPLGEGEYVINPIGTDAVFKFSNGKELTLATEIE